MEWGPNRKPWSRAEAQSLKYNIMRQKHPIPIIPCFFEILVPDCFNKQPDPNPKMSGPTQAYSWLGPDRARARACAGLVFGLSPQTRPHAHPQGQARKSPSPQCKAQARPKPALYRPDRPYSWHHIYCGSQMSMVLCNLSQMSMVVCNFPKMSIVLCNLSQMYMVVCNFPKMSMVQCNFLQMSMVICNLS
jgi:hypothetical protein